MATATVNLPNNVNRGVSSKATILGPEGAGEIEYTICPIHPGTTIRLDKLKATVVVIRPFVIELTPTEEGYTDEVLWLRRNLEQLSPPLQDGFRLLQNYLRTE